MNSQLKTQMSPKDFFLHISSLVVLYIGFGALINLLFRVIDANWPTELGYLGSTSISWPVAALIVLFPLFLGSWWLLLKSYKVDTTKKELTIRKWLIYLTLFVALAIIAGNLITLLYFFLDGRILTLNFISKSLVLFVLSVFVFSFYLLELQNKLNKNRYSMFAGGTFLVIFFSIVWGFTVMGSPATQRSLRLDNQRVNDLSMIQQEIINYWQTKEELPESINDLEDSLAWGGIPTDPVTRANYIYERISESKFELCADFDLETRNQNNDRSFSPYGDNWQHEAGYYCFERNIDSDRYPFLKR